MKLDHSMPFKKCFYPVPDNGCTLNLPSQTVDKHEDCRSSLSLIIWFLFTKKYSAHTNKDWMEAATQLQVVSR